MASLRNLFFTKAKNKGAVKAIIENVVAKLIQAEIPYDDKTASISKRITAECMDIIEDLLSTNPDAINAPLEDGSTLLHYAVNRENAGLVSFLLSKGADLDAKNNSGYTPVHLSLLMNRLACFDALHQHVILKYHARTMNNAWHINSNLKHHVRFDFIEHNPYIQFLKRYINFHYKHENNLLTIKSRWTHLWTINNCLNDSEKTVVLYYLDLLETEKPSISELYNAALVTTENDPDDISSVIIKRMLKLSDINTTYCTVHNMHLLNFTCIKLNLLGTAVAHANDKMVLQLLSLGAKSDVLMPGSDSAGRASKSIQLLELALLPFHSSPTLNPRYQIIQALLMQGEIPRSADVLNHFIYRHKDFSQAAATIQALLPLTSIQYDVSQESILKTVNDNPLLYPYLKVALDDYFNTFNIQLKNLTTDSSSFLAGLPHDILVNYIFPLIRQMPPIDNTIPSDATRAAAMITVQLDENINDHPSNLALRFSK